jgi:hypothetical protein
VERLENDLDGVRPDLLSENVTCKAEKGILDFGPMRERYECSGEPSYPSIGINAFALIGQVLFLLHEPFRSWLDTSPRKEIQLVADRRIRSP